jgi:hypothetical protein
LQNLESSLESQGVTLDDYYEGIRYHNQRFADWVDARIDDISLPGISRATQVIYKEASDELATVVIVPGGRGQICFGAKDFENELLMPMSLFKPLAELNVSTMLFNSTQLLPMPYDPLIPLPNTDEGRVIDEHFQQVAYLVKKYSQELGKPLMLLGHSSSCATLVKLRQWWPEFDKYVKGLILLSSKIIYGDRYPTLAFGSRVDFPILAVSHENDKCPRTPPKYNEQLVKFSTHPATRFVKLSGGISDGDVDPCLCFGHHGFYGIEKELCRVIRDFIADTQGLNT